MDWKPIADRLNATYDVQQAILIISYTHLPMRFQKGLLKVWADEHGYILTPQDYASLAP